MRIGQGFDVHRLVAGQPLILGGVTVPYDFGLLGHSDADVLVHAVMDALLGAIGSRDIGHHFPDTDPAYKGAQSTELLKRVMRIVNDKGFKVQNIDATIIAEKPKLAGYISEMRGNLAGIIEVDIASINIKATTTEGLGFTGSGEGIAAMAVALLKSIA